MSQQLILYQSILVSDRNIKIWSTGINHFLSGEVRKGGGGGGEKYSISDLDGKHSMWKAISNSEKKKV